MNNLNVDGRSKEEKDQMLKTAINNAEFLYKFLKIDYQRQIEVLSKQTSQCKLFTDLDNFKNGLSALEEMRGKYIAFYEKSNDKTIDDKINIVYKYFVYNRCLETMINNVFNQQKPKSEERMEEFNAEEASEAAKEINQWFDDNLKRLQ